MSAEFWLACLRAFTLHCQNIRQTTEKINIGYVIYEASLDVDLKYLIFLKINYTKLNTRALNYNV